MSFPPSQWNGLEMVSSWFWRDREVECKSGRYAATLTLALVLAGNFALLWPRSMTLAVPLGDAPLRVEIRRILPLEPAVSVPELPKPEVRKLLHETFEPNRLTVPDPLKFPVVEEQKTEPPKLTAKTVKKMAKPQPKSQLQTPLPSATEMPPVPTTEEGVQAGVAGRTVGHTSGQADVTLDETGAIVTALLHTVDSRKEYPRQARRAGVEGKVVLRITLGVNGRITACALVESSGKKLLDAAAEKLGATLVGLDVPEARGKGMTVRIPVRYALKK